MTSTMTKKQLVLLLKENNRETFSDLIEKAFANGSSSIKLKKSSYDFERVVNSYRTNISVFEAKSNYSEVEFTALVSLLSSINEELLDYKVSISNKENDLEVLIKPNL